MKDAEYVVKIRRLLSGADDVTDASPWLLELIKFFEARSVSEPGAYMGKAWEKPYPGATGTYIDQEGHKWQVIRVIRHNMTLYIRWDIDGEDSGATFLDTDGGKYEHDVFYGPRYVPAHLREKA